MAKWKKIGSAPTDGTWILAIVDGRHPDTGKPYVPSVVSCIDGKWVKDEYAEDGNSSYLPTHWMAVPAGPSVR